MVLIQVDDEETYDEITSKTDILIAGFIKSSKREGRYFNTLLEDLAWRVRSIAKIVIVDADKNPIIARREGVCIYPALRLYLNGNCIWEQEGCFMDYAKDMLVIRRSIRSALKSAGVNVKI